MSESSQKNSIGIILVLMIQFYIPFVKYWMHELQASFPYVLNNTVRDEFETDNPYNNVATKFSSKFRLNFFRLTLSFKKQFTQIF